jgi:hypothetical protein
MGMVIHVVARLNTMSDCKKVWTWKNSNNARESSLTPIILRSYAGKSLIRLLQIHYGELCRGFE